MEVKQTLMVDPAHLYSCVQPHFVLPHIELFIYLTLFNCFAEVANKGVIMESNSVLTSDSNADKNNTDGKPHYLCTCLQSNFVSPCMNLTLFTCTYSFADVVESDKIPVVAESDKTQDVTEETVLMDLDNDDYYDDDVFDHDAYGKCDACTVFFITFHQILKFIGPGQFLTFICAL